MRASAYDPAFKPRLLVLAGLVTGTMDIVAASLQFYLRTGKGPDRVLRFIASGIWGKAAFSGGSRMAVTGLLLHYGIAFTFSGLFLLGLLRIPLARKHLYFTGILYGVFTWAVMNLLVLPFSAAPAIPFDPARATEAMLILIACIGLPLAWISHKYYL